MSEMNLILRGYRLTTAEILYHMPDHPDLLQSFIWQDLDLAPKYPILTKFLEFWQREIEGQLHSVNVNAREIISPNSVRHANISLLLH